MPIIESTRAAVRFSPCAVCSSLRPVKRATRVAVRASAAYLIRKLSLESFVPFISSRIQIGVMPRPVHFSDLSFFD